MCLLVATMPYLQKPQWERDMSQYRAALLLVLMVSGASASLCQSQGLHAAQLAWARVRGKVAHDGRATDTEQELQLQSAKVMQKWNTLVKLKFVLIPSVSNRVNENRSNQIKIISFITLQHCKTFQGSAARLYKPEIDAVPLFTSKTTKVKF